MIFELGVKAYRVSARNYWRKEVRRVDGRLPSYAEDLLALLKNSAAAKNKQACLDYVSNLLLTEYIKLEIAFGNACIYDTNSTLNGGNGEQALLNENYGRRASMIATACAGLDGLRARLLALSFDEVAHEYKKLVANTQNDPRCMLKSKAAKACILNAAEVEEEIKLFTKW